MAQWHVKVATSAGLVERAGTSYVERKTISDSVHNHTHFFPNKNNLLTCAKRQDRRIGGAEQARHGHLGAEEIVQLRFTRRPFRKVSMARCR